jgi:hypothetical protein
MRLKKTLDVNVFDFLGNKFGLNNLNLIFASLYLIGLTPIVNTTKHVLLVQ